MKKLLFILITTLTLSSCTEPTLHKTDLPIEVVSLREEGRFDTILETRTDQKIYRFSKERVYLNTINQIQAKGFDTFFLGLIIGFFITLLIVVIALSKG